VRRLCEDRRADGLSSPREVEGEALQTLLVQRMRGGLKLAAVPAPGLASAPQGDARGHRDILTGGTAISGDLGSSWKRDAEDGSVAPKEVIIDKGSTHRQSGGCRQPAKSPTGPPERIKGQINDTTSDFDREQLQARIAKLAGGVRR